MEAKEEASLNQDILDHMARLGLDPDQTIRVSSAHAQRIL